MYTAVLTVHTELIFSWYIIGGQLRNTQYFHREDSLGKCLNSTPCMFLLPVTTHNL